MATLVKQADAVYEATPKIKEEALKMDTTTWHHIPSMKGTEYQAQNQNGWVGLLALAFGFS
jgi:hypothetical protein